VRCSGKVDTRSRKINEKRKKEKPALIGIKLGARIERRE